MNIYTLTRTTWPMDGSDPVTVAMIARSDRSVIEKLCAAHTKADPTCYYRVVASNASVSPASVACHTYLPTSYNDGSPIRETTLEALVLQAVKMFGGATVGGEGMGLWMHGDKLVSELVRRVDVAVPPTKRDEWDTWLQACCQALEQVCMYSAWGNDVTFLEHS